MTGDNARTKSTAKSSDDRGNSVAYVLSPPPRDVVLLGAGASLAGGLPNAAGFTDHLLAARRALDSLPVTEESLEAIDKDLSWLLETQERLRRSLFEGIQSRQHRGYFSRLGP